MEFFLPRDHCYALKGKKQKSIPFEVSFKQNDSLENPNILNSFQLLSHHKQAIKLTDFGKINYEDECMKRKEMVHVPNWFTVDAKTGVGGVCFGCLVF